MSRQPRRFQPSLESLEDRCTPSSVPGFDVPDTQAAPLPVGAPGILAGSHDNQIQVLFGDASGHSDTRVVPFKITGSGNAPDGVPLFQGGTVPHTATGWATELGNYTGQGTFQLDSLNISSTGAVTGTFQGSFVFVAANGDKLAFNYGVGGTGTITGQLSPDGSTVTNVNFVAYFTPDPQHSTGRFADVTGGGFTMTAHADSIALAGMRPGYSAPFDYTWSGQGTLDFSNGKK